MKRTEPQFAVCIRNKDYPASLELRKLYRVIGDAEAAKHQQIRVVDESGEDYSIRKNISSPSPYLKPPNVQCCAPLRSSKSALRSLTSVFATWWKVDFCEATGHSRIDRFHDALNMRAKARPLLQPEDDNRDFAVRKILR